MPQHALLVSNDAASLDALNERLRGGWRVARVAPLGGGGDALAALVVLEHTGETEAEALLGQIEEEMDGDGATDEIQDPVLRRLADDAEGLG